MGAGLGAAAGALIGYLADGKKGAMIGGLAGGATGGLIGNYVQRKDRDRTQAVSAVGYRPSHGNILRIEDAHAMPTSVKPGQVVNLDASYTILTPNNAQSRIQETREVRLNGRLFASPSIELNREDGTYSSRVPFTVPLNYQRGSYEVRTIVAMGPKVLNAKSSFVVE